MIKNHKNIILSLILIIIAFFGYWYFFLSKKDTTKTGSLTAKVVGSVSDQQNTQKNYDKEFVSNLQTVQYISLDTSILDSVAYEALSFPKVPFRVDYIFPIGRGNPFLPIGVDRTGSVSVGAQSEVSSDVVVDVKEDTTVTSSTTKKALPTPKKI